MFPSLPPNVNNPQIRTIHVNPNFNCESTIQSVPMTSRTKTSAHINPLFVQTIHMNPAFVRRMVEQELRANHLQVNQKVTTMVNDTATALRDTVNLIPKGVEQTERKIISKTRTKIIREPVVAKKSLSSISLHRVSNTLPPLVSLTKRKLVRIPVVPKRLDHVSVNPVAAVVKPKTDSTFGHSSFLGKYKIDKRQICKIRNIHAFPVNKIRRRSAFVGRYALRRSSNQQAAKIGLKSTKLTLKTTPMTANKSLQLLNINGVLYKSTPNKLQRKDGNGYVNATSTSVTVASSPPKKPQGRTLFVRGMKFIMDSQGLKLTRMPSVETKTESKNTSGLLKQRQRIDIGGLTYVASKTHNVLVRTRNHLAIAHLASAKQRSLHLLSRHRVKSNIPCAIFQRIGKCVAFDRGKCSKVHNKLQVTICPRFLRGECDNSTCLLSHNVSLSKMPVCKFFLQGICARNDCPYLHKKLSQKTEICVDFLRGFCRLAEQCNKRHEFLCPEFESKGKCSTRNCIYCKNKNYFQQTNKPEAQEEQSNNNTDIEASTARYFIGNQSKSNPNEAPNTLEGITDTNNDAVGISVTPVSLVNRPKVGNLPMFIPFS